MRIILVFTILLSTLMLNGQRIWEFNYTEPFDWSIIEKDTIEKKDFESILISIDDFPFNNVQNAFDNFESLHIIDIDNDGINEFIYNGHSGGEGEVIMIIKNKNNGFEVLQRLSGRIIAIDTNNHKMDLIVLDYSCCGGYVDHLQRFFYNKELNSYKIVEDIATISGINEKMDFITPINFKIVQEVYNMRDEPIIKKDLNPNDYPFDLIQNQNISAVFKKGDTGLAIAKEEDETGRVWWLVIMNEMPEKGKSIYYKGNNGFEKYKLMGWMSNRYLEY